MVAVQLREVVAVAAGFPVLAGVSLDVAEGEVVAVLGANGAGKTSLLRTMAGLVPIHAGRGIVLGVELGTSPGALGGRVGLVGHAHGLYDELSPLANLRFVARVARRAPDSVAAALAEVGINDRVAATPMQRLSAGQRRRVALAAVQLRAPELLLLDEPHAAFDTEGRALIAQSIAAASARGAAVVFTSHDPDLAQPLADRVLTMAGGIVTEVAFGQRPKEAHDVA